MALEGSMAIFADEFLVAILAPPLPQGTSTLDRSGNLPAASGRFSPLGMLRDRLLHDVLLGFLSTRHGTRSATHPIRIGRANANASADWTHLERVRPHQQGGTAGSGNGWDQTRARLSRAQAPHRSFRPILD